MTKKTLEMVLKVYKIPNTIYQYRSINKYLIDSLKTNTLFFSNPFDFNDPFECRPAQFVAKANDVKIYKKFLLNSEFQQNIDFAKNLKPDLHTAGWLLQANHNMSKKIGVSCFTTKCDDVLMWSHYADSHKGICLIIDTLSDPEFIGNIRKVKYVKIREKFNYLRTPDMIYDFFSKKYIKWKYEDEVRIFKLEKGPHSFKKELIKGVIFGCNTSVRQKNKIRKILIANGYTCEFYQAITSYNDYSFKIDKIE